MFDKVLASVRIGAAEVDTLLDQDSVRPGESLPVRVVVDGGGVDQEIDGIELELKTRRDVGDTRDAYEIASRRMSDAFTIEEDARREFEGTLPIHRETPVTTLDAPHTRAEVWIDTDLEIDQAIDADDTDYLRVRPTDPMAAMLDAVADAGHTLREVTVDNDRIRAGDATAEFPVDQEFVFRPSGSSDYDEVEIHFLPRDGLTYTLVEFDYRVRSEQFETIRIDHDDYSVEQLRRRFESLA